MGLEQNYEAFFLYLPRYLQDQRDHVHYESFSTGLHRLEGCAEVTQDMDVWRSDAPWMTAYFSVGVWISIWLGVSPMPGVGDSKSPSFDTAVVNSASLLDQEDQAINSPFLR